MIHARALIFAIALAASPAAAEDVLVHSDLPLFRAGDADTWPQNYSDDESFGSVSIFPSADWRCVSRARQDVCEEWFRARMDGVIHPKFIVTSALEQKGLEQGGAEIAFIGELLSRGQGAGKVRVFALQIGVRPGSTYRLFAVRGEGRIRRLQELDVRCEGAGTERREMREGMDVWLTSYCAVENKAALKVMALEALDRPPLALFESVAGPEDQTTPDP
jgi:hypothetical protein